jgi:hypothetical protein
VLDTSFEQHLHADANAQYWPTTGQAPRDDDVPVDRTYRIGTGTKSADARYHETVRI